MYQPFAQEVFTGELLIRASVDAATLAPAATRIIRELVPQQPIEDVLTLEQIREESVAPRRLNALLVGSFGALALLIAAVGIAGVFLLMTAVGVLACSVPAVRAARVNPVDAMRTE